MKVRGCHDCLPDVGREGQHLASKSMGPKSISKVCGAHPQTTAGWTLFLGLGLRKNGLRIELPTHALILTSFA